MRRCLTAVGSLLTDDAAGGPGDHRQALGMDGFFARRTDPEGSCFETVKCDANFPHAVGVALERAHGGIEIAGVLDAVQFVGIGADRESFSVAVSASELDLPAFQSPPEAVQFVFCHSYKASQTSLRARGVPIADGRRRYRLPHAAQIGLTTYRQVTSDGYGRAEPHRRVGAGEGTSPPPVNRTPVAARMLDESWASPHPRPGLAKKETA